jgi:hypothetical protein
METLVERCAGLDVHKCSVTACVRVPDAIVGATPRPADSPRPPRTFMWWPSGWPGSYRVIRVGMESTGRYWKPGWHLLEDQVECWLLNAAHMHTSLGVMPTTPMRPALPSWSSTAGQSHTRRHLRKAGRNVPFDPLCAATSYAPGKRTACRDTQ